MKNLQKPIFRILFIAFALLTGCGEEDSTFLNSIYLSELSGEWALIDETWTVHGQTENVYYDNHPPCTRDNIFYFTSEKNFQILSGYYKCVVTEQWIIQDGAWDLTGKQLITEINGRGTIVSEIKKLNATTLILSTNTKQSDGTLLTSVTTFIKRVTPRL